MLRFNASDGKNVIYDSFFPVLFAFREKRAAKHLSGEANYSWLFVAENGRKQKLYWSWKSFELIFWFFYSRLFQTWTDLDVLCDVKMDFVICGLGVVAGKGDLGCEERLWGKNCNCHKIQQNSRRTLLRF
jgi:hypothetical protein